MTILDDLDDDKVFGHAFKGASFRNWRVFLQALFGLDMNADELAIFRQFTGRTTAPTQEFTEAALIIGRRGGKSRILALICVYLATSRDYEPYLAPGECATVALIATDRRAARNAFRFASGLIASTPLLAELVETETSDQIILTNRVVIEVATASWRVTRGYNFAAIVIDEIAFLRTEDSNSANPDTELVRALRPGLASIPGSKLIYGSSPYRKAGVLWDAFKKYHNVDGGRVLTWQATSLDMNPTLDPAVVAEAYEFDPASAAAEFGAVFRTDINSFVDRAVIDAATPHGLYEIPPAPRMRYSAFVDPSGGSADSMTLAIAHASDGRAILDCVREVKPPFSPEAVVMEFAAMLKLYGLSRVTGDRYAGEWPRERFKVHGIQYALSALNKGEIYLNVLPLLNSGRVDLLDIPRLAAQFCGLERRAGRGGRDLIDHAAGGAHDDIVNSVAGALLLAGVATPMRVSWEALKGLGPGRMMRGMG